MALAVGIGMLLTIDQLYLHVFLSADKVTEETIRFGNSFLYVDFSLYPFLGGIFLFRNCAQGIGQSPFVLGAGAAELLARIAVCSLLPAAVAGGAVSTQAPALAFYALCAADPMAWIAADAVLCCDLAHINDAVTIGDDDYVVIMTNGHRHDFVVEEQVLRGQYAYIGVIGSRTKTASVNALLRQAGISEEAIAAVHTPIGTAIKAVTPEEIAVSIAGEMICVRATRREDAGIKLHGCPMH